MNKLASVLALVVLALVVLAAASRPLIALASGLVPILVVAGLIAALLRCIWFFTGPR
jgi:hypothetical protein